jgi:hypothetical protein
MRLCYRQLPRACYVKAVKEEGGFRKPIPSNELWSEARKTATAMGMPQLGGWTP